MKKRDLGDVVAELVPSREHKNPRNSEGAFLTLKDGSILFAYSRFKGEGVEDWGISDICAVISKDGGRSFTGHRTLLTSEGENAQNIMSLSLLDMENGDIGMFYLVRHTYTRMQMYLRRSKDGGKTWTDRVLCTPQEGYFVVNNDRVVRLASGRILIPAAFHRSGCQEEAENGWFVDSRSEVVCFYSDDDGVSWQAAEGKCCMPFMKNSSSGLQEPGVLELEPGVLWGFARTDLGRQYEMYSLDHAKTWTGAAPSRFTAPNSPLSMKRDKAGVIWAVWNPIPEYNGREKKTDIFTGGRTPYVIAASTDNGQSFTEGVAFEAEEDHGYCYCAIHFLEDGMLLGYCAGGPKDESCLARIRIRKIGWQELECLKQAESF
ncbi:MAG: glycoside hydrolase [Eubacterium sp.]|nr:glycoside hydrolase [Eubacterium sp.]